MTDKQTQALADESNMQKDPSQWVTGDEPMTGAQRSYLKTLSEEAHEPFDPNLSKADASRRIDELQARTGRGSHGDDGAAQPPQAQAQAQSQSQSPSEAETDAVTAAGGFNGS
jgi:DNA uptake protein ComE-like DNA-binding protein